MAEEVDGQDAVWQQRLPEPFPHAPELCAGDERQGGIGQNQVSAGEGIPVLDEACPVFKDAERGELFICSSMLASASMV